MSSVKVDTDIWRIIKTHYLHMDHPSDDDIRVQEYIIAKLAAEARRAHYHNDHISTEEQSSSLQTEIPPR